MIKERTLVLIKPDGIKRNLCGEIISRFEKKGYHIVGMKLLKFDDCLVEKHYKEHIGKEFYPVLKEFIQSGPSVAMVLEGDNVISETRKLMGATSFLEALPGTIRGDLALHATRNLVHGSDSVESAKREIPIFFSSNELISHY